MSPTPFRRSAPWAKLSSPADQPVVPSGSPGIPDPGPDFLAEVDRTAGVAAVDYRAAAAEAVAAAQGGEAVDGLDEAWHKQARSKAEKTRATALNKAAKQLEQADRARRKAVVDAYLTEFYRTALYSTSSTLPIRLSAKTSIAAPFVPGHVVGSDVAGPAPARVMVVSKMPGPEEVSKARQLVGKTAEPWQRALKDLGAEEAVKSWYATSLVRHPNVNPSSKSIPPDWIANCLPILAIELQLVRPDYVLCLGAEAAKALTKRKFSVTEARNKAYDYVLPARDGLPEKTIKLVVIPNPAIVFHDPTAYDDFRDALAGFLDIQAGIDPLARRARKRTHTCLYKEHHLAAVVDDIIARPDGNVISLDCEWHGEWYEPEGWLRTVQFSPRAGEAYVVVLRHKGGTPAFVGGDEAAARHLNRLLKSTPGREVRPGGHFFRSDLPWLMRLGVDIRDECQAAADPEGTKHHGGWDTYEALHSLFETSKTFELETWAVKLLGIPRYDGGVHAAVDALKKSGKKLGGYGEIPDDVLHPYAAWDVDATRELWDVINGIGDESGLLDRDRMGINSRRAYWLSQGASPALLDMEMAGVPISRDRIDVLTMAFMQARTLTVSELRDEIRWPDFNPNSTDHRRELLFGERFNARVDPTTGAIQRQRPKDAVSLNIDPVKSTADKDWSMIDPDEEDLHNPSSDKEVLGILSADYPIAGKLRDVAIVGQVLKFPFRPPVVAEDGLPVRKGGHFVYDGGIADLLAHNDRIYTKFFNLETGRYSTRPSMQNLSKKREEDYKRILGDSYEFPLRTIIEAPPGWALVEADYKSAEVAILAWLSNDALMLEDVRRSLLPKSDPDFVNIHCKTAVDWFKLDCPMTKKGLESIGKTGLYTAAKNVRFGVPYGRGDKAILRQCKEEGASVTLDEIRALLALYDKNHPSARAYLSQAARRVSDPGYLMGVFGRPRRFGFSKDRSVVSSMEREAYNAPIQNAVGDAMRQSMRHLYEFKRSHKGPETFEMLLNIHDALLFAVPIPYIDWLVDDVLHEYMCRRVPIRPADLDGDPIEGLGPYYFGVDVEVYLNWGEAIPAEKGRALGVPERYLKDAH